MHTRLVTLLASLLSLALLALVLLSGQASPVQASPAAVRYVAPGGTCGGKPNCYAGVQAAVDAAAPGDEIRVATGIYTDTHARSRKDITATGLVTQVVYISKTVTLRGGYSGDFALWDPHLYTTTLDAQSKGRVIYITGDISPTIEGLSMTGGDATGLTGYDYAGAHDAGGGVYVITATATLNSNRIFSNTASYGGGAFLYHSDGQLDGNTISDNHVDTDGGGLFLYQGSATVSSNSIISNTANDNGGGLNIFDTNAMIQGNRISGNTAVWYGGGVDVASCDPTFSGNIISGNTARNGGGMYLWYSRSTLTNNVIADNQSVSGGSGLWIGGSQPRLLQTTIARNTGGGGSGVRVADDNGSGTYSTPVMTNTILVSQTTGISVDPGNTAAVNGVLWFGNGAKTSGTGTVTVTNAFIGNPAFASDGYHLTASSAAIDKGVSSGVATDIDGLLRFGMPDLGADEYLPPGLRYLHLPSIMRGN
jgi:parallel beta-helix repeat protein